MAKEFDFIFNADNTISWEINTSGQILGTYRGIFKFRAFLNPQQILNAGKDYRKMLGDAPQLAPPSEESLAYVLSQLKQRVIEGPHFWNPITAGGDIPDQNVLNEILEAAIEAEMQFRASRLKKLEKAKEQIEKAIQKQTEENLLNSNLKDE